jgi:hypothetical protein
MKTKKTMKASLIPDEEAKSWFVVEKTAPRGITTRNGCRQYSFIHTLNAGHASPEEETASSTIEVPNLDAIVQRFKIRRRFDGQPSVLCIRPPAAWVKANMDFLMDKLTLAELKDDTDDRLQEQEREEQLNGRLGNRPHPTIRTASKKGWGKGGRRRRKRVQGKQDFWSGYREPS